MTSNLYELSTFGGFSAIFSFINNQARVLWPPICEYKGILYIVGDAVLRSIMHTVVRVNKRKNSSSEKAGGLGAEQRR